MKKNGFQVLVIPDDNGAIKEISISRILINSILSVLGVLVLGLSFYSYGYYSKSVDEVQLQSLQNENLALISKLKDVKGNIQTLSFEIVALNRADDMLRVLADLPEIHEDIRQVGVGGPDLSRINSSDQKISSTTRMLTEKIFIDVDKLLREAKLQEASFTQIQDKLAGDKDKFARIPTIQPTYGYLTAGYGYRRHPFTGRREFHHGLDIANREGTPIYGTGGGVVEYTGVQRAYGQMIIINHGYGYKTLYAHLSKIMVRQGQKIKRGDMIAKMGTTGRSTGPHLHYEVIKNKKRTNPVLYFYGNQTLARR